MRKILLLSVLVMLGLCGQIFAQDKMVTGKVTDSKEGSPLPGVTVTVKGTTKGTTTDASGNFKISASENSTLLISSVGFTSTSVKVGNRTNVNIALTEDVSALEEVVVTGLASSIKRSNTANAVAKLDAKDLMGTTSPATLDGAMSGKLAGANIRQNSGAPGGGISVQLRGPSSVLGSSEPLYVIDGVIMNNSQFNTGAGTGSFNGATSANSGTQDQAANRIADLNPNDIESMDILKGPSAAAVYGTRANAGVIVITTKRGKAGRTNIKFAQDIGFATAINLLPSSNWDEAKIKLYGGYYGVDEATALATFRASNGQTVDYDKEVFGNTGTISNSTLTITGGNDKTRFFVSGGINEETGIVKNTGFGRRSIRVNVDQKVSKAIDFGVGLSYVNSNSSRSFLGNDNNGVSLGYSIAYLPNFLDLRRRPDGTYPVSPGTGQNPFEVIDRMENKDEVNRFNTSGNLNILLLNKENSSLRLATRGGIDYLVQDPRIYAPEDMQFQAIRALPGSSRFGSNRAFNTYLQSSLTYTWKLAGVDMATQAVYQQDNTTRSESWIQGDGLLPNQRNPATAARVLTFSEVYPEAVRAYDFNHEFNWGDKIIARVGVRNDRTTLVGDPTKWFTYPRANAAFNLHKFDFFKSETISQLKARVAFGQTGGYPRFGDIYSLLIGVNYGGKLGSVTPSVVGNPGIQPERAQELEFGIDLGLLKNKITIEASYYDKIIKDFLFAFPTSNSTGVSSISVYPAGDLTNKGVEIGVNVQAIKSKNLSWNTGIQFWNNRSNVPRLAVAPSFVASSGFGNFGRSRIQEGFSPTLLWGRDAAGNSPLPIQEGQPDFQMSWKNSVTFGQFDFSMLWHWQQGGANSSLNRELKDEGGTTFDWSEPEKAADGSTTVKGLGPRLFGNPGYATKDYIFSTTYFRMREVALNYNVPKASLSKVFGDAIQGVRIGVSGQNLINISDYFKYNYDPEASNFGNRPIGGNIDLTPFPSSKRVFFKVVLDF
jgi:TonB-linked SusC/RagA family outer membrane protein